MVISHLSMTRFLIRLRGDLVAPPCVSSASDLLTPWSTFTKSSVFQLLRHGFDHDDAANDPSPQSLASSLDADREFLTQGGVFTDDLIDAYIALKGQEVEKLNMTTHPVEFEMYYSV